MGDRLRFYNTETVVDDTLHIRHAAAVGYAWQPSDPVEEAAARALQFRTPDALNTQFECIHGNTVTLNYTYYPNKQLRGDGVATGCASWTNPYQTPLIKNHDTNEEPLGRCIEAVYIESKRIGCVNATYSITDSDTIQKILDGRYLTVSVGGRTDSFCCSICGKDWLNPDEWNDCPHWRGREYEDELCYLTIGSYWNHELSWVAVPADQLARMVKPHVEVALGQEHFSLADPGLVERLNTKVFHLAESWQPVSERSASLPLAEKGMAWDGSGAKSRMLNAATSDGKISRTKASRGFCAVLEDGSLREHYKLPFADVLDGTLKCVYRGCVAALGRLNQTQGLSEKERSAIRTFLEGQTSRFGEDDEESTADEAVDVAPSQGEESEEVGMPNDELLAMVQGLTEQVTALQTTVQELTARMDEPAPVVEAVEEEETADPVEVSHVSTEPTVSASLARAAAALQLAVGDTEDLDAAATQLAERPLEALVLTIEDLSQRLLKPVAVTSVLAEIELASSMANEQAAAEDVPGSKTTDTREALPGVPLAMRMTQ